MLTHRENYANPLEIRLLQAQFYAAQVRERKSQVCTCERCEQIEKLEAVQLIIQAREAARL